MTTQSTKALTTQPTIEADIQRVSLEGEPYFKISDSQKLRPFFMSIVSDSNHWLFISSNGGLTAGRKNAQYALFPYYTDDKITELVEVTGSKTIFRVEEGSQARLWEPFSVRTSGLYQISRNLYKHAYGHKIVFEEVNHDLQLTYRYQWSSSNKFGFARKSTLVNQGSTEVSLSMVDGVQNVLPYGVESDTQNKASNLVDAYKRSELISEVGIGIYALSAIIVDKAEPSEALKANTVWSTGLSQPRYLLSSLQLDEFRAGATLRQETDIKAEKGAYFVHTESILAPGTEQQWMMVANVNQDYADIARLAESIKAGEIRQKVEEDIALGTQRLLGLCAASDGLQLTADPYRDARHFSNTLFNIMRGGIFDDGYAIERWDFISYLKQANRDLALELSNTVSDLPEIFSLADLKKAAVQSTHPDFKRLCLEYLPLKFSRRHGDPSRPWNQFSINTRSEVDGSKILDYEGNWRDIFQNWEALAHSYPGFIESMIHKFLNASTFDGYNPYRVTKDGFDWETIEPDNPWSYIGYWGDHQIIYLLKFLEFLEDTSQGGLEKLFVQEIFVYANVPYQIKTYEETLENPKDTIVFDEDLDRAIRKERESLGADGALLQDASGNIIRVNFIEKILATTLAKLSNFIPEGGIWMNTQRPEWNDANNALVGNGISMVTLYYLRRFMAFFQAVFASAEEQEVSVSEELAQFFAKVSETLDSHQAALSGRLSDKTRRQMMDGLGQAGSDFRTHVYEKAFSGNKATIPISKLKSFCDLTLSYLEHSMDANERDDHLYHAYNLMTVEKDGSVSISYLDEMLEGQVAVLSAKYLSPAKVVKVLDGLKNSSLFRKDQYSYILYPNKPLPSFTEKNIIPENDVQQSALLSTLVEDGNTRVIKKDVNGDYHFNGNFRNAADLKKGLNSLADKYQNLVADEKEQLLNVFEKVFNHKAFTGRSGTFYGYEGLGSIYWHMVSKLLLAVQECSQSAIDQQTDATTLGRMLEHFYEIMEGIGVHKSPALYGAFPTDPYSHTPMGKGAQQPGMTGQVKEDILSRFGELGISFRDGQLCFTPGLLRKEEFLSAQKDFSYVDVKGSKKHITLPAGALAFTYCQIPVIYRISDQESIRVTMEGDAEKTFEELCLDASATRSVFERKGEISHILVYIREDRLK